MRGGHGSGQPDDAADDGELCAGEHDDSYDAGALRAERHADGHLLHAERDREGDDAVDTEDGEQDGDEGEGGDDGGVEAAGGFGVGDGVLHRLDLVERELGVDAVDGGAEGVFHLFGRHGGAECKVDGVAVDFVGGGERSFHVSPLCDRAVELLLHGFIG